MLLKRKRFFEQIIYYTEQWGGLNLQAINLKVGPFKINLNIRN